MRGRPQLWRWRVQFFFLMAVALRPRNGGKEVPFSRLYRRAECRDRIPLGRPPRTRGCFAVEAGRSLNHFVGASRSEVLIRLIITAIADYAAETTERRVAPGSRRGSHGEERRHPRLNIRRSCSAVSAPRCQAGAPPPFCSHGYERAFPEPYPVRRLAGTSRPAIQRDGGATQGK